MLMLCVCGILVIQCQIVPTNPVSWLGIRQCSLVTEEDPLFASLLHLTIIEMGIDQKGIVQLHQLYQHCKFFSRDAILRRSPDVEFTSDSCTQLRDVIWIKYISTTTEEM